MRLCFLALLFLPSVCFSQNSTTSLDTLARRTKIPSANLKSSIYPEFVMSILNGHFKKLEEFYTYSYGEGLDAKLKSAKPYSEYLRMKPFSVGILDQHFGDTTILTIVAYKENFLFPLANVFKMTKDYWNFQGWFVPVFRTKEDGTFLVTSRAGDQVLFKIGFTGTGVAGETCFLLKNECSVCEND
jgi:hypothetical protein